MVVAAHGSSIIRHWGLLLLAMLTLVAINVAPVKAAWRIEGRVTRVIDGDSLLVKEGGRVLEVRLWGIDCPEYDQPYGRRAKAVSHDLLDGRSIRLEVEDRDSYGRLVALVYRGDMLVNEELVHRGTAWVYGHYCRLSICRHWRNLQRRVRSVKKGLWRERRPTPPWVWRHRR